MANKLADETSPYLLQHADDPVDWHPWGEEALQKARAENKPIFLSIGYSSCHWCHVMAHESFEDEKVAAILNQHFVSIKVDREERPDLDQIYMAAVQALTSHGGWPMSVFLTPEGRPFYGGTYFPPTSRHGMPSFSEILTAVADAWEHRRQEVLESGQQLVSALQRQNSLAEEEDGGVLRPEVLDGATKTLQKGFDGANGGWGTAPKFPQPMVLEFLLRRHHRTGELQLLNMVTQTLQRMARGGIYDQLGGGFHRYSVDSHWLVPHFEKMLYDNAQLARVYLHAWQVTGEPLFRAVAEETLDYLLREMADPSGGFYSTQDADSEGVEGKFYVWTPEEIRQLLGEEAASFLAAYNVSEAGNFEGKNILTCGVEMEKREALFGARQRLLEARSGRIPPGRDEKVLTSWNGLMLAALAEAARALDRADYRESAQRNADFLLRELQSGEGRLLHSWKEGDARINGYLEDYTHLIDGLLELYQTTFEPRWYVAAQELAETMIRHFGAPGGFYDTSDDHEELILRPRELGDNAVPSGNAVGAFVLLRLAGLAADPRYSDLAEDSISRTQPLLEQYPTGFGQWLIALDYAFSHPREIAILGDPEAEDTRTLLEICAGGYRPHQVLAAGPPGSADVPLLRDRDLVDGRAAAYVCVDHTCLAPVADPEELRATLQGK